jgi:hypothetical protein
MKKVLFLIGLFSMALSLVWFSYGDEQQDTNSLDLNLKSQKISSAAIKADIKFGKIPLYFLFNKGQVHKRAKFYTKASRYTLWLTKEGLVFDSTKRSEVRGQKSEGQGYREKNSFQRPNASTFQRDISRLTFIGSNKNPEIIPLNQTKLKVNYLKGNDPSKWVGGIPTSQAVLYKNLYKNIDLKVYGIEKQIEYDWIVRPGGNPEDIRFEYENVERTRIDKQGNLVITTKFGKLIHKRPVSYQKVHVGADLRVCPSDIQNEKRITVHAAFKKIKKNTYGLEVGAYDKSQNLIIDPMVLVYSTYLGGNGWEYGYGIDVDSNGYVYVTGSTPSTDFPILNQYQIHQSINDVYVSKFDTTQSGTSSLVYSTYLGGTGMDFGTCIAVDNSGIAYISGHSGSTDFPTLNQYMSDPGDGTEDAFVTKLDTTQSGASCLLYSTYLGGDDLETGTGIAIDSSGKAYVSGHTYSTDFPTLNQYMSDPGDADDDAFVTTIDTTQSGTSSLLYSTYLGGSSYDSGSDIALDSSGKVHIAGYTNSTNFPTLNQYMNDPGDGVRDAFITKMDTSQSGALSLLYSTYLGGDSYDYGSGIAVDSSGYTYVTGGTDSTNFPALYQYQTDQATTDVFITKMDTSQSGAAGLLYSTYLGGDSYDYGIGIAVDSLGNVYVSGHTNSTDFPTRNEYQLDQPTIDTFVTQINPSRSGAASFIQSTYLGGNSLDYGQSIAIDSHGYGYVTGYTLSTDFPCVNQYMIEPGDSTYDSFVSKLSFPSIRVNSPNGGENWTLNTSQNITWEPNLLSNNVYIVLKQQGVNVALIAKNINPLLGTYTWAVGDCLKGSVIASTSCKILVREKNSTIKDVSDSVFTISNPYVTVTSPNGGEDWQMNTTKDITWDAAGLSNDLYIVLRQNGVNVALIAKNINPVLGSYSWNVGDSLKGTVTSGTNYRIAIIEKNSSVADKSNAAFTISN